MDSALQKLTEDGFSGLQAVISALGPANVRIVSDNVDTVTFFAEYKDIQRVSLEQIATLDSQLLLLVELSDKFCAEDANLDRVPELLKGTRHITVMYVDEIDDVSLNLDKPLEIISSSEPMLSLLTVSDIKKQARITAVPKENKGNVFVGPFDRVTISSKEDVAVTGKIGYYGEVPGSFEFSCPQSMLDVFSDWHKKAKDFGVSTLYLDIERGEEIRFWLDEAFEDQGKFEVSHIHDMTFSDSLASLYLQAHTIENVKVVNVPEEAYSGDYRPPIAFDLAPRGIKGGNLPALPRAVLKNVTLPPKSVFMIKFNITFPQIENLVAPDSTIVLDTGAVFGHEMRVFKAATRSTDYQFLKQATTLMIRSIKAMEVLLHAPRDTFKNLKTLRIDFIDKIDCQEPWDTWENKSLSLPCLQELYASMPRDIVEKAPKWKMPSLKKLHLEDNIWNYINKKTLANVAKQLPQLQELELKCSSWAQEEGDDGFGEESDSEDDEMYDSDEASDYGYDSDGGSFFVNDDGDEIYASDDDDDDMDEEDGEEPNPDIYGYGTGAFSKPGKVTFKHLQKLELTNVRGRSWTKFSFPALKTLECNGIDVETFDADAPKLTELTLSSSGFRDPLSIEGTFPLLQKVYVNDFGAVSLGEGSNQSAEIIQGKRRRSFGLDWDI